MNIRAPFIIAAILICLFNSGCNNKCPATTTISTGESTGNWLYENKDLGLRMQLPYNWYFNTHVGRFPYSVVTDSVMPDNVIVKKSVQLKDLEKWEEQPGLIFDIKKK